MPIHTSARTCRSVALRWTVALCLASTGSRGSVACAASPAVAGAEEQGRGSLPSGSVSLREAVAAALLHSPDLATYSFEVRAQEARALQEGLLPNPSLSTEVENFGRFGGDDDDVEASQTTVSLTQLLELGGKRGKRASVARLEGRLAGWDYERARLDTAAKTLKAFVAGLLAQERLVLAERLLQLAHEVVGAVRRQVDAGADSPVELTRAEASLAQAEASRARREREYRAARIALAATWGGATADFTRLEGTLEPPSPPRPLEDFREQLRENPDLARWATAVERARADVVLEEARRVPDVTVRFGSRRFVSAETNAFVAELSVPLPIFNRNQGAIQEAYERLGKTRAEQRAVAVGADATLSVTYEELLAAVEQARQLKGRVLPRTQEALEGTRRAYTQGVLRYLDVLDAQRTVSELEGDYLEALARYHAAAADLERLTGIAVTDAVGHTK